MKITKVSFHFFPGLMEDVLKNKDRIIAALDPYLADFKVSNLPETAPANIPRIIASSKSGMFNVTIANSMIQIEGAAKALAAADDDIILNTVMELVDKIGSYFEDYIDAPFNFCGYTLTAKLKRDEIGKNAVDFMTEKINGFETEMLVDNSMIRTAYIQKDYYINLTVKNEKDLSVKAKNQYSKPVSVEYKEDFLVVEIDVNDKYGFINNPEYNSEIENALQLIQDVNNFYNDRAIDFIQDGSVDYFC